MARSSPRENSKTRRRPGPRNSSPAWATFGPKNRNTARSSLRENSKCSEGLGRETHRPPGPHSAQNAVSRSSAMDGDERFSREQNRPAADSPQTLVPFCFLPRLRLHPSERGGRHCDRPEERRRRASAHRRATLTRG
jgi:hypothetical protein